MSAARSGSCLCGAVRFIATPKDTDFGVCHCSMCRKWAAGPFFAVECPGGVQVADDSKLGVYRSSEWAERPGRSAIHNIQAPRVTQR